MKKYNLCNTCKWCFTECPAKKRKFDDIVIGCDKYFAKEYAMKDFMDYPNMYAWITSKQFCDSDEVYTNGAELITVNDVLKGWNYYMNLTEERARADAIYDAIKKLAESEDTILTDKQYYTLMELIGINRINPN